MTTRFGEYALDDARRELLCRGAPVHLTPKAHQLLSLLLERRPAAVSKAEIHDRIWPATFVSDVNLATLVFEIRSAIGDDPQQPRYIRTVRGFGYAFQDDEAPPPAVRTLAQDAEPHARLIWGEREIALREGEEAQAELSSGTARAATGGGLRRQRALLWTAAVFAVALSTWLVLRTTVWAPKGTARLTFAPPARVTLMNEDQPSQHLAFSPGGERVVFMGRTQGEGIHRLYVQAIGDIAARVIPGTEKAHSPFFSPEGRWIAFQQGGQLKKLRLDSDEAPVAIADLPEQGSLRGASWGPDGTIVFSPGPWEGLWRVPAVGGKPSVITRPEGGPEEVSHRWPQILPTGKDVLFTVTPLVQGSYGRIGVLSLETGTWRVVAENTGFARYSATGHLVYARLGALFAAPFDPEHLVVTGPAAAVLEDVQMDVAAHYYADFDVSASGALVYVPGFSGPVERSLLWVDRQGRTQLASKQRRPYATPPRLSPDGGRVVVRVANESALGDLWLLDLKTDAWTQLTFDAKTTNPLTPEWSPDGRSIAFVSSTPRQLMRISADGSAPPEPVGGPIRHTALNAWTPSGRTFVFSQWNRGTWWDIGFFPLAGGEARWFPSAPYSEWQAAISPDERYLAYVSDESGASDVYVRSFPGPGGIKHRVSTAGGVQPRWSRDGRELYYRSVGDRAKLMAVTVDTRGVFRAGQSQALFDDTFAGFGERPVAAYDVSPDGHFLFSEEPPAVPAPTRLVLIPGWTDGLRAKLNATRH